MVDAETVAFTKDSINDAFRKLDKESTGLVERATFQHMMIALFPAWADGDVEAIIAASNALEGSSVRYAVFSQWLFFPEAPSDPAPCRERVGGSGSAASQPPANSGDGVPEPEQQVEHIDTIDLAREETEEDTVPDRITATQFVSALANMVKGWEAVPVKRRCPAEDAKSFFEDDCLTKCGEMIERWHSGRSSHPDKTRLSQLYSVGEMGQQALLRDLEALRWHPAVREYDDKLRLTKYSAPPKLEPRKDLEEQTPPAVRITVEQFAVALSNMVNRWKSVPMQKRLPAKDAKSFFEDDLLSFCREMIERWHSGTSSHPDRELLASGYTCDDNGTQRLHQDLLALRNDSRVKELDRWLRQAKYAAPIQEMCKDPAGSIDRVFNSMLQD